MAEKNKQYRATFFCVDDVTQEFVTGESSATLTMKLFQDHGSATDPTNEPAELDAVNAPGVYTLLITQGEMGYDTVMLYGLSTTDDVRVIPVVIQTNQIEAVKDDVAQVDTNVDNARAEIGQLNDFDPATQIVKSNIEQVQGVSVTNADDFKADVSGLSTFDNTTDEVIANVTKVNDVATGIDDFKADVSGLSTFDNTTDEVIANVTKVNNVATGIDDFKADVSGLSTFDNTTDEVTANVTKVNNVATGIDDFKADVSDLALEATVQAIPTDTASSLDVTQSQASIEGKIDASDLKITEIQAGVAGTAVRTAGVTTYFDPSTSNATHKMSDPTENGRTRSEV